jgi:uncharacterized 2Fe-2S/4Fe-4S cluster protein (DUF4445 family)
MHKIHLLPANRTVESPTGSLITEAIQAAELDIAQPCGGQGRCGRCAVIIEKGSARRRSIIRLSSDDLAEGYALACQTIIEGELTVSIPEQAKIERRLITDLSARKIEVPFAYDSEVIQSIRVAQLQLSPPSIDDNIADQTRLLKALTKSGFTSVEIPLLLLQRMSSILRESEWAPWIVFESPSEDDSQIKLLDIHTDKPQLFGIALDIGTTTVTAYLVDLTSGQVKNSAAEYNSQIARGEDVISRIIFASKDNGLKDLGSLIRETFHTLLERIEKRTGVSPSQIYKLTVSGNTTMIHLFLGLPPEPIRQTPYIPTANHPQRYSAKELDLPLHPLASVDCLPGVASYVGADISAGVLASGLAKSETLTLFIDVGTNGEIVLGTQDWMLTCACSAGPAFEGAGVVHGMRATEGAIEEVWVHSKTFEPTYRVIGGGKPKGLCGSGLISLLAELFVTGVVDRAGNVKLDLKTSRVRQGEHGPEYVVAWADETETEHDIVLTKVDVDNLLRAKAAIYAGYTVLARSVEVELDQVDKVLIGGAFGKYINVENAIKIGLLPDLPWERFQFLGNTSVLGAYMALLSTPMREAVRQIADRMTYVELSADNQFFDAFTAALFLPHTDIRRFPNVAEIWERENGEQPTPQEYP